MRWPTRGDSSSRHARKGRKRLVRNGKEGIDMTSPEQIKSNAENAKKSTGPRSEAGKARSRSNALKHGMTARVVMLPDENPEAFRARMNGWADELRPRTGLQCFLLERVVYSSWQLDRATRANSAHLSYKAETCVQDERERVEAEADVLGQRLFRPPFGRPAAHPYAAGGDAPAIDTNPETADAGDHPRHLIRRLEESVDGCQWLLTQWNELGALLSTAWPGWRPSDSACIDCWAFTLPMRSSRPN